MLVQPRNRLLVLVPRMLHDPDDDVGFLARRIGDDFPQMVVVGVLELVLDDDTARRPAFPRKNIHAEAPDRGLRLLKLHLDAERLAERGQILLLCQPLGKVMLLMRPDRPQIINALHSPDSFHLHSTSQETFANFQNLYNLVVEYHF